LISAALFAERAVWPGIATILISAGNVIAHAVLFNIRGRAIYNAGMATALLLFLPMALWFFVLVAKPGTAGPGDCIAGVAPGLVLNVVGILKMIGWMADRNTADAFSSRQMLHRRTCARGAG